MLNGRLRIALIASFMALTLSACSIGTRNITIVDAKTAASVDEKLMPVKATEIFPKGTKKVSCWFQWRDARLNTQIIAKWHYVTDDIHIIDHTLTIPRKDGSGCALLTMPAEKDLPSGLYKVEIVSGSRVLKSLTFRVE